MSGRWKVMLGPALFALLSIQCSAVEVEAADCPELTAPTVVVPGEATTVRGGPFVKGGCGPWSPGCASRGLPEPAKNITVTLRQGDTTWLLAETDALPDGPLSVDVDIPAEVEPGPATITADSPDLAEPEELAVQVEPSD